MKIIGVLTLIGGVGLSLIVWIHDYRRLRIAARLPQAAPSRVAPEAHAIATLLTSAGTMIVWWWAVSLAVLALHAAVAFAMPRFLERIVR